MPISYIDLSHPLSAATPPWPGNPGLTVSQLDAIREPRKPGQRAAPSSSGYLNVSAFHTCTHTGTHMDAPAHFYTEAMTIEAVPLRQCLGRCALANLTALHPRDEIQPSHLAPFEQALRRTRKILLFTGWASHWLQDDYFRDFPVLSESAARWLIQCGCELVGVDTPSVDREPNLAHFVLLGAKAVIVENLTNLHKIESSEFELIVLPLPLAGLEASPVRAVAVT